MAGAQTMGEWIELLNEQALIFSIKQSPETARNMLVLCSCIESAIRAYLFKQKMEDVIHGDRNSGK